MWVCLVAYISLLSFHKMYGDDKDTRKPLTEQELLDLALNNDSGYAVIDLDRRVLVGVASNTGGFIFSSHAKDVADKVFHVAWIGSDETAYRIHPGTDLPSQVYIKGKWYDICRPLGKVGNGYNEINENPDEQE